MRICRPSLTHHYSYTWTKMITIFKTFIGIHMSTNMKLRFIQVWTTINFLKNMDKLFVVNIEKYISPFDLPLFFTGEMWLKWQKWLMANLSCKLNAKQYVYNPLL